MDSAKLATCICAHDDDYLLKHVIKSFSPAGPVFVAISRLAFDGSVGNWERTVKTTESAGGIPILGDWPHESLHRRAALVEMRARDFSHILIPDSDEVIPRPLLDRLICMADARVAARVHVHMNTYWKSPEYVVRPREALTPAILLDLEQVKHFRIREYSGGSKLVLPPEDGLLEHLSYVGSDERIERKISSWGHRTEVVEGWYPRVWKGWDTDRLLRDLHPTHPPAYHKVERIKVPEILADIPIEEREEIEPCVRWPKLSIVIPLHGGETDIRRCLQSLAGLDDLIHETIVVDDKSPDRAASVAESFSSVTLLRNESNLGFAATCNAGYRESSGEVVIFLNSDTIVPRPGLIRLIESLMSSKSVAAAGPYSNNTGHHQQIASTYESLETMPLFADDLARSEFDDQDVDMLVGFCLAVKREILEEIGVFDERFGIGMFEDNDLCYRIRRAGFRLVLSRKAFVHHEGSRSLARRKEHPAVLLTRNQGIYFQKWKDDLECGFCSHLSGTSAEPIVFDPKRKPEVIDSRIRKLARKANICLCMIVKNEERVLAECLNSIKNGITQLVIVDTGSTDRSMEIARAFGAELHQLPWPDSYSDARNHSLKFARRPWIMWMDADDTITRQSLEAILLAVIHASKETGGFIVPIRFVDEGPNGGTQVDHVKVFPALPGMAFEGYIHEQVLPSIRAAGKEVVRIKGAVIHHSGYDTSVEGQKVKREREKKLLKKDHEADPTNPFKMFNPGMTCHYTKQHEEAIDWLSRSIAASGPHESQVRKAYALMGVSKRELGDNESALAAFEEGLSITPDDPELLFQSAISLTQMGRLQEAVERYLQVPSELGGHFSSIDVGILTFKRYHNLGTVYNAMGNYGEARRWWQTAIQAAPNFTPSAVELFEASMAQKDFKTALEALSAIRNAEGPSEGWAIRVVRHAAETGQNPEQAIRGALQATPYAVGPLLVLARMLLERGDERGAAPLFEELDRLGCGEGAFYLGMFALRRLDLWAALEHMSRSKALNPCHEPTQQHVSELRRILTMDAASPYEETGEEVLFGPHVGELGPASGRHSVVVVCYNSVLTIGECASRVLPSMGESDELILVDNASSDGTVHVLQGIAASDERVKLIQNTENLGYSRAANIGMLASKGAFVTTLNPDAYVNAGWLESLESRLVDSVAAVGPMSDNIGGEQFVGHLLDDRHPSVEELSGILSNEFSGKTASTKFLVGICVMARRETLDKHGLLDEFTELGADDLEFSWRMRMLGQELAIAQDVFVSHERGVSFASLPNPERVRRQGKSDAALARKLEAFYGKGNVPSSMELWGAAIFDDAFHRIGLLD